MKPVTFKQANMTLAENQPPYQPLPVFKDPNSQDGRTVSCWKLSIYERLRLLFTGKIWVHQLTFHQPLQPQFLDVNTPFQRED